MPIIVRGIGSVQAFNTVTVKSRVDGNIEQSRLYRRPIRASRAICSCRSTRGPIRRSSNRPRRTRPRIRPTSKTPSAISPGTRRIVNNQLAVTRQQYDTQRATVEQDEATVQSDQAQIDAAKLNVAYCAITSPIDGITGLRLVDIGNLVQASAATPLVVVTQIKPIYRDVHRSRAGPRPHPARRWRSSRSRFWLSTATTTGSFPRAFSKSSTTRSTRTPGR